MSKNYLLIRKKSKLFQQIGLISFLSCHITMGGTVAWFYALDADKTEFERVIGNSLRTVQSGSITMYEYQVGPQRLVAAQMGSGCVNTTATVATLMALNSVDRVISTGPAGMLNDTKKLGTWVWVESVIGWQSGKATEDKKFFPGERSLTTLATCKDDWPEGEWAGLSKVKLVSGEAFIASTELRSRLALEHNAEAVEMNAYGLLAGIEGRQVKILILRVFSDLANEDASEEFTKFTKTYDGKGGTWVAELVKKLPLEANEPAAHGALRELMK